MSRSRCTALFAVLVWLAGSASAQLQAVRIVSGVADGLADPVYLAAPPGDDRLFVVERGGTILIVDGGIVQSPPFLNITNQLSDPDIEGSEGGLLGLVFAPDYPTSGAFYVYYTAPSETSPYNMRSVVARFTVTGNPVGATDANEASLTEIFTLDQPYPNHNGGTVAIREGWLYLGLGDGGLGGDPQDRAQDDGDLLGKMIRLDLATPNPTTGDWEIYAKGLRNPFRYSFDRLTGDLYIGDVGQATQEEIDAVPADAAPGLNFGWDVLEGTLCFDDEGPLPDPGEPACNDPTLIDPVATYDHAGGIPGFVIGGAVYRGQASGSLRGDYFFADGAFSRIYQMRWDATAGVLEPAIEITSAIDVDASSISQPVAIAEDSAGEIYFVSRGSRAVHRLVPEPVAGLAALAALGALASLRRRALR